MENYSSIRDEILNISHDISDIIDVATSISGDRNSVFKDWSRTCDNVNDQISKEILRIAVVGAIKSGKSTFVNSLLQDDYLKRGAGIVTSIVTRIRKGMSGPKATLYFKSWDEVNNDIEQAMVLLPEIHPPDETDRFDIRRQKDRMALKAALDILTPDLINDNGTFNANCILISNYLSGFEKVKDLVDSDNRKIEFSGGQLIEHKTFSGNDALSVYLKDILLELNARMLNPTLEIADCQGSDSPNPLHLAMIQDYLVITHFIVYVISSRTGVRQADMRFLSMIKKMGIMDHLLFVVNCDFNEHDSASDLDTLVEKIKQELSVIKADPKVFVFSSLYNLFKNQKETLDAKNKDRLEYWQKLEDLPEKSDKESERFFYTFTEQLINDRFSLLLKNHLERLNVVNASVKHWVVLNQDILSGDLGTAEKILSKIKQHQEKIVQIKKMIRDTLDGAVQKLINELKKETDHFFSERNGEVVGLVLDFVEGYQFRASDYERKLEASGFNNTLYLVFQDFKQEVDRFMAESVNPPIIKFIKEKEVQILEFFKSVAFPYEKMIIDSFDEYNEMINEFGVMPISSHERRMETPDMEMIKRLEGFSLPPANATLRYSARIKTDAVIRFGVFSVIKLFKKAFKKPIENEKEDALMALKQSMVRMKQETIKSIVYNFKNYRENIKFQYILKLVEKTSNYMFEQLSERFQFYMTDLTTITDQLGDKENLRKETLTALADIDLTTENIFGRIEEIRRSLNDSQPNEGPSKTEKI